MRAVRWISMTLSVLFVASASLAQSDWGRGGGGGGHYRDRIQVDLDMGGMEYKGNHTIRLRQLLKERNPWMNTREFRLENITILAKSQKGQGSLKLVIAGQTISQVRVPGDERSYFRNDYGSYNTLKMNNFSYAQDPSWVLSTNGNIRILQIKFNLVEDPGGGGHHQPVSKTVRIATGKLDKFIEDRDSHSVRVNDVRELRILSLGREFVLKQVTIGYANGSYQTVPLHMSIQRNRDFRIQLQGRDVRHIEVTGTSTDLIGSRAEYAIDAIVRR